MATGMAIMGFGGGAFIASPLSVWLMSQFTTADHVGVWQTFVIMGAIYFCLHDGRRVHRSRAAGRLAPEGWTPPRQERRAMITRNDVYVYDALKTPQFWLIWWVLCLNVTAGIGVLGQASAMTRRCSRATSRRSPRRASSACLACSTWAAVSSGPRRRTYRPEEHLLRVLRARHRACYCTVPYTGSIGSVALFVICFVIIISMYGGGFATVPAYLEDMFGTRYVGAIHGRLLTAWSAAGIFGPVLVNYIREYQRRRTACRRRRPTTPPCTSWPGLLVIGFICNFMIKAVNARFHMKGNASDRAHDAVSAPHRQAGSAHKGGTHHGKPQIKQGIDDACSWPWPGASSASRLTLGVLQTLVNAMALFQ